jgi:glycosyltransferase involved in cell wall biosynthesis
MSEVPPVSIGLPVYNGSAFLAEAIDSILAQTYGDVELVISDNASTDATQDICRDYAARDPRLRYLRQAHNLGAAENYNRVFHESRGRFFRWASHDDLLEPGLIEACVRTLESAGPSVVLCYPRSVLVNERGERLRENDDGMDIREALPRQRLVHVVKSWSLCNAIFGLIRREALVRSGLIRKFVSADVVLLAELALMGQFWEIPEPLFLRRIHDDSSRGGDTSADEAARWFDPNARGAGWLHPRTQLFFRVMTMVRHADLPPGERAACMLSSALAWWLRRLRVRAGALRRQLPVGLKPETPESR